MRHADQILQRLAELADTGSPLKVLEISGVNGPRVKLKNGSWALVNASSKLVVACKSTISEGELVPILEASDHLVRTEAWAGLYDRSL